MAVMVRARRLVNPSIRRTKKRLLKAGYKRKPLSAAFKRVKAKKRNPSKKRKLSPKQIAIFGTPRQKAALRAKRSKARNPGYKKMRKRGQHLSAQYRYRVKSKLERGGYTRNPKRKRRVKNVGEIVSISLAGLNPGRKRRKNTGMAKRRRRNYGTPTGRSWSHLSKRSKKRNPGTRRRRRMVNTHRRRRSMNPRRRRNPIYRMRRLNRGRRRNPSMGSLTNGLIGKVVGFIGGMLGARYLTQLVLGGNNTGWMGYGGNIAASVGLGMVAGKITSNKEFGQTVMVGGIAATVLRYISENTSYGSLIQTSLSGAGKGGDFGLGIITDSSFPVPQVFAPGSMTSAIVPSATRSYVSAQVAQASQMAAAGSGGGKAASGMGRMPRRAIM